MSNEELNEREKKIWYKIRPKYGVLFLLQIPGVGKSATTREIARKKGLQYIDLRLSTKDETDLGRYPVLEQVEVEDPETGEKKKESVLKYAIPDWAKQANEKPTLIHVEELNRCREDIRNASLGFLLEKIIGHDFKFNENVYFVASGNPIESDNDVEELGNALRNRLIIMNYNLSFKDWKKNYAEPQGVNEYIISYLNENTQHFVNDIKSMNNIDTNDNSFQYPTPRSWTNLSAYLNQFKNEEDFKNVLFDMEDISSYIGEKAANGFVDYCQKIYKVSIKDILDNEKDFKKIDTMNIQRLLNEFTEKKYLHRLTESQKKNWYKFLEFVPDEKTCGFLNSHIEKYKEAKSEIEKKEEDATTELLNHFWDLSKQMNDSLGDNL